MGLDFVGLAKRMRPDPSDPVTAEKIRIGKIPALILRGEKTGPGVPGVLWIHGGGCGRLL